MNASKCFQPLTRKYLFFNPRIHFKRFVDRNYTKKPGINLGLPSMSVTVEPSVGAIHPNVYSLMHCSSEASRAEEYLNIQSSIPILKFEDLSFESPVPHEELLAALQKCKSLSEQMETLASTMALSSKDIENRKKFCKTLELLFKPFFNNFKIQMFGSTVNYFGFKGCDIDMTFETTIEPMEKEKIHYCDRPDVPLVSEVLSGKISPQEISQLPFKEQLIFMHTVLLEYYKESTEPSIFINAHVPLVRFYHDKFNLKCDLTFKNDVAYANTKLLYFYAKLDKRVAPLIMTIRYWAKHVELIGKGLMFNTYTITLLVIHFLQTRKPPIIPSAESILSLSDSFKTDDMDDNSFLDLIDRIPPSNNFQPLDELFKEFFFYFLYFDYSRVIVPLVGTSIPRKEFMLTKDRKFTLNTVSVQDPLCTSHNVAELVEFKCAKKLYSECLKICQIIQEIDISAPSSDAWGLMPILDKPTKYEFQNGDFRNTVSFILPFYYIKSIDDGLSNRSKALLTAKMLLKMVDHVLLFKCSHLEDDKIILMLENMDNLIAVQKSKLELAAKFHQQRNKKGSTKTHTEMEIEKLSAETMVEQFRKVNAENELILCCKCEISKNVWTGRESIELNPLNLPSDLLNREHSISKEVAKQNEQNVIEQRKKMYAYLLECYISSSTAEPSILVNFRPLQQNDFNSTLGIFLKDFIPKIMNSPDI